MAKSAFVYVTDERGFELVHHSALSLALSQPPPCNIHIFCYRFPPKPPALFQTAMASHNVVVTFHDISDAELENHQTCLHVTTPTLLKPLAVDRLVGQYDRIVYLDNDLLVFDKLGIEDIMFGQMPLAAVVDMDLSDTGALRRSKRASGGEGTDGAESYFNAGFLIFDAKNWRSSEFLAHYTAELDEHDIECRFKINCTSIDQCALNRVFAENWVRLPMTYNLQGSAKFTGAWQTAAVRHYAGRRKFIPISMFRNDSRDVRYLNLIRCALGLPRIRLPALYKLMYRLNFIRNYRNNEPMRRFMRAVEADVTHSAPAEYLLGDRPSRSADVVISSLV